MDLTTSTPQGCGRTTAEAARPPGVDDDCVAALEIGQRPPQFEGVVATRRAPRRTSGDTVLVDDRRPPDAAPARLPEPEPQLDPAVARTEPERRACPAPAFAGDAHFFAAAVVVGPRLSGSRREREHEQRQQQETGHGLSVRRARRLSQWDIGRIQDERSSRRP